MSSVEYKELHLPWRDLHTSSVDYFDWRVGTIDQLSMILVLCHTGAAFLQHIHASMSALLYVVGVKMYVVQWIRPALGLIYTPLHRLHVNVIDTEEAS